MWATVEERLTTMTRVCRAAWLATGWSMPLEGRAHRASQPGEVYWPDHASRACALNDVDVLGDFRDLEAW
ncbi:MAG: hypothetical protein MUE69_12790 [Myxococcota bacterium]|jgi:hypothetical protein|nr:hypothetical protein [Myxococcota bacterium]